MKHKKRCLAVLLLVTLVFTPFFNVKAVEEVEYDELETPEEFVLAGEYLPAEETVELKWKNVFASDYEFNGYFLLRSTDADEELVVPDVLAHRVLRDKYTGIFSDEDLPDLEEVLYYRVCSIPRPKQICSNVIKIDRKKVLETYKDETKAESTVVLTGELKGDYVDLRWNYPAGSPDGYMVLKSSTHENPAYPPAKGDTYKRISGTMVQHYKDEEVESSVKQYYYRVCILADKNSCKKYSNSITIRMGVDSKAYSPFEDIREHWGRSFIEELHADGVIKGVSETAFDPDRNITRAEFLKIVLMAMYRNDVPGRVDFAPFEDVTPTDWYAPYAKLAKDRGFVKGYDGGKYFRPNANITRAEAIKIALVAKKFDDFTITNSSFIDVLEAWQIPVVEKAKDLEIVGGYDDKHFGPNDPLTRAQASKIISLIQDISDQ